MNNKITKPITNHYSVHGINNSFNLLSYNENFLINKIFIDKSSKVHSNVKLINIIESKKYYTEHMDHNSFIKKYNYKHSQGIVIEFTGDLYSDLYSLNTSKDNMCIVIADQLNDPQNLGQILRTCECAGIDGIILPQRRSIHLTDSVLQVSQGAFCNLNIIVSKNIKYLINELKENDYWVIGIENSINSKNWYEIDMKGKVAFVFGSEGEGMRPLIRKYCDHMATIPMVGTINSLNISATVSAILFERNRQILKSK